MEIPEEGAPGCGNSRCQDRFTGRTQCICKNGKDAMQRSEWRWCWGQRGWGSSMGCSSCSNPDSGKTVAFTLKWVWANEAHIMHTQSTCIYETWLRYWKDPCGWPVEDTRSGAKTEAERPIKKPLSWAELTVLCSRFPPAGCFTHGSVYVRVSAQLQFVPYPALWWPRGVGWVWWEGGDICILTADSRCCTAENIQRKPIMLLLKNKNSYCTITGN